MSLIFPDFPRFSLPLTNIDLEAEWILTMIFRSIYDISYKHVTNKYYTYTYVYYT